MLRWMIVLFLAALAGCATVPPGPVTPPLFPVSGRVSAAPESITFLLPGALTTSGVFGPAQDWGDARNLVVEYRLPGMQGQPLHPALTIHDAARWVARYANRHPQARINLLGYSTGAAIAIEAAPQITDPARVTVIGVSPATPFPGAALAALRGGVRLAGSAVAIRGLDWQLIWEDTFKTLWFGTGWRRDAAKVARAEILIQRLRDQIETPGDGKGRAQSADLLTWTLPPGAADSGARFVLFHGELDPVFPLPQVERLAVRLKARLCVLPQGGHLVLQSQPDLIRRIRSVFLSAHNSGDCG